MAIFVFVSFFFGEAFRFLLLRSFCQDGLDATFTVPWVGGGSGDKVGLVIQGGIFSSIKVYLYHSSLLTSDFRTYDSQIFTIYDSYPRQLSNEKRAPGWLGYIGDEKLPSYVGIIIPHYKDPVFNQPGFNWKVIRLFFSWLKFRYIQVQPPLKRWSGHQ